MYCVLCIGMERIEETHIIERILAGETDLFVHIVRQNERMIFTIVNQILQNKDLAEDLVQDIFIKVFQQLSKYKNTAKFSTWLYRVAYNESISYIRKNKNSIALKTVDYALCNEDIEDELPDVNTELLIEELHRLLSIMPHDDAFIITLFYLKEIPISEISEITRLSVSNIKVKLHRIRKYLYGELQKTRDL